MIRPLQDNVLLALFPDSPKPLASGVIPVELHGKSRAYGHRKGLVLAVGPGHHKQRVAGKTEPGRDPRMIETGAFVPTETKVGEIVVVAVNAGDNYSYVKRQDFADMYAAELAAHGIPFDSVDLRMVRDDEVLAVLEGDEAEEGVAAE